MSISLKTYSGSCLCATVKFTLQCEFSGFYLCHCRYCQKDTGSAHAANLFAQSAQLTWLAGEDAVNHFVLPGTRHSKSFCRHCGSALPFVQHSPAVTVVPAGCLDDELCLRPTAHIFTDSKAGWDTELALVPAFGHLPE
ncbi:MAG TPA: GFA family protein [Pseudomonadales bacterium]